MPFEAATSESYVCRSSVDCVFGLNEIVLVSSPEDMKRFEELCPGEGGSPVIHRSVGAIQLYVAPPKSKLHSKFMNVKDLAKNILVFLSDPAWD